MLSKDLFDHKDSLDMGKLKELQSEVDSMQDGSYIDEPGIKSVTIESVALHEQQNPKEGWVCVKVVLKDVNGRTITAYPLVPTTVDLEYPTVSGKNKLFALKKLQQFGDCFGISFRGPEIFKLIKEFFGSTTALVGKTGNIRVGYEHSSYCEKYEDGFCIISNGKPVVAEDGEILCLPTRKDVSVYGTTVLKKKISIGVGILEFIKSDAEPEREPEILGM